MPTLAELRETRGLTQEMLAEMTGIPRGTIARHEAGFDVPRLETAMEYARAFNVPLGNIEWAKLNAQAAQEGPINERLHNVR